MNKDGKRTADSSTVNSLRTRDPSLQPRGVPAQRIPAAGTASPGREKQARGRLHSGVTLSPRTRLPVWSSPRRTAQAPGSSRRASAGQRPIPQGLGGGWAAPYPPHGCRVPGGDRSTAAAPLESSAGGKWMNTGEVPPLRPRPALTSSASFPRGMPMARRPVCSSAISTLPSSLRSSFLKRLAYRESPSLFPSQAAAGKTKPRMSWNMARPCGLAAGRSPLPPRGLGAAGGTACATAAATARGWRSRNRPSPASAARGGATYGTARSPSPPRR